MSKAATLGTSRSNVSRNSLESLVENKLIERGYTYITKNDFITAQYLNQPIYTRQFAGYKGIYGTAIRSDFILFHPKRWPDCLVIECKWQETPGTTDEKYPYFILNIKDKSPYKTILALGGGAYRVLAERWLKSQVGGNLLHVFNTSGLRQWLKQNHI